MESTSGAQATLWTATARMETRPALAADLTADVCIVGAGIAGLSTAYTLAREGASVVVLDDGRPGGGMTERTTAHLSNAVDDRYTTMERLHGRDGARIAAASHTAAIDCIETIIAQEQIDCDFVRVHGYLFAPPGSAERWLEAELHAAERAGLRDVTAVDRAPLEHFDTGPCLRFPRQAQFHPLRYLAGLLAAVERRGGRVFGSTHVTTVTGGAAARVEADNGRSVQAGAIVVATNTPINDRFAIHTKQAPYNTYVVGGRVPRGSVTAALYWDTEDPYHYVRLASGGDDADFLIVGGEDHKSGQADDAAQRLRKLEQWARERFPMLGPIELSWSGQVMEPSDGVAFIGRNPGDEENVYIATGDSGMGMTHGTIAALLLTDLVMGRESPWARLYDPARKMLRAPLSYAKENLNVAAQYVEDYFSSGDVASADEIKNEQGALLRRGASLVAAYRDQAGVLHERSAVCPHLGCVVQWDALEKTWDCPCHGSRFDCYGKVIVGPANRDLATTD